MNFEGHEGHVKGLASKHRKENPKIVSGLTGAAFDASYTQFVDENDEEFNDNLAESMHTDKMGTKFHMDTP